MIVEARVFDCAGTFNSVDEAIEYLHGFVFGDCEYDVMDVDFLYLNFIEEFEGVSLYYDMAGDDYLFIEFI